MLTSRQRAINLGIALGKTAKARGITQKAISDATGYPTKTISRVCRGEFPAMSETLCAIAGAIGVEIIIEDAESNQSHTKKKIVKNYIVGILSDQVQGNHAAHVRPLAEPFENKTKAVSFAIAEHNRLDKEFTERVDFGNGAIKGESVVISSGGELLSWSLK